MENSSEVARWGGRCDSKRICTRELGGNGTALNPDLGGGYMNAHMR